MKKSPRITNFDEFKDAIAEMFVEQNSRIDERFDAVDARFDKMDERMDRMDDRFDRMDERFDVMDARQTTMERDIAQIKRTVESIDDRLLRIENDVREIYLMISQLDTKKISKSVLKKVMDRLDIVEKELFMLKQTKKTT
jgi:chromosome segregation ATPase